MIQSAPVKSRKCASPLYDKCVDVSLLLEYPKVQQCEVLKRSSLNMIQQATPFLFCCFSRSPRGVFDLWWISLKSRKWCYLYFLSVVFVVQFQSAGKSAVLNSLIGHPVLVSVLCYSLIDCSTVLISFRLRWNNKRACD